jgi:hypothetical protein
MTKPSTTSKPTKKASPDKLIKTSKKGDIELTEEELRDVTGGVVIKNDKQPPY